MVGPVLARLAQPVRSGGSDHREINLLMAETIECIAEYTNRPLMVLTSSDIGTKPEVVEMNLTKNFKTARSWGAVLLIDEADVFMERRSTSDLTRNSLVAGKTTSHVSEKDWTRQCLTFLHW